jgi:tRNA(Ile)-lysidine synthase
MDDIYKRFLNFSTTHSLFTGVKNIVVGVSGGVDSMIMLDILLRYAKDRRLNVVVTHLNHKIRGKKADEDEKLVSDFCNKRKIPFYKKRVNVEEYAEERGLSTEIAGREVRYSFFHEIAAMFDHSVIATAHTLDDHIETVLLRIFKGTGLQGLEGIPIRRENVIRPLRFACKQELYEYAKRYKIPYSEDHTNYEEYCQRNVIRNSILPKIAESVNPNVFQSIDKVSLIVSEANESIKRLAKSIAKKVILETKNNFIILNLPTLNKLPTAIKKEIVRVALAQISKESVKIDFEKLNNLLSLMRRGETGKVYKLSKECIANIDRGRLIIYKSEYFDWDEILVHPGKTYRTTSFELRYEEVPLSDFSIDKGNRGVEFIDLDKIDRSMKLRHWRYGDRVKPIGFSNFRKISDLFIDEKIPRLKKEQVPILENTGEIVWVCGIKLSDNFKITSETKRIFKLEYREI